MWPDTVYNQSRRLPAAVTIYRAHNNERQKHQFWKDVAAS